MARKWRKKPEIGEKNEGIFRPGTSVDLDLFHFFVSAIFRPFCPNFRPRGYPRIPMCFVVGFRDIFAEFPQFRHFSVPGVSMDSNAFRPPDFAHFMDIPGVRIFRRSAGHVANPMQTKTGLCTRQHSWETKCGFSRTKSRRAQNGIFVYICRVANEVRVLRFQNQQIFFCLNST